jgi:hypothetical protein
VHWNTYKHKISNSCNTYSYYLANGIQDTEHTAWPVLMESFHPMWCLPTEVHGFLLLGDFLSVQRADTPERCCVELCEGHAYSYKLEALTGILISCSKCMNLHHYLIFWNKIKFQPLVFIKVRTKSVTQVKIFIRTLQHARIHLCKTVKDWTELN